jgi:hypothetical protein
MERLGTPLSRLARAVRRQRMASSGGQGMGDPMAEYKPSKQMKAELLWAGICEALCFVAGVVGFFLTGSWLWIAIGILAGLGFSVPAIIKLFREMKEHDRASR